MCFNISLPHTSKGDSSSVWRSHPFNASMWFLFLIIGAVVINHASAASQLEQEELKNKILNDWEKRRSFSVIKYQLSGELNWFSDSLQQAATNSDASISKFAIPKAEKKVGKVNLTTVLDFENSRWRVEEESDALDPMGEPNLHCNAISVFSGGQFRAMTGDKTYLHIRSGETNALHINTFDSPFWIPIFFSYGVVVSKGQTISGANFAPRNDASSFKIEGYDTKTGDQLAVLLIDYSTTNRNTQERYWVDLKRESVIVKYHREAKTLDGQPLRQVIRDINYALSDNHWLLSGWTMTESKKGKLEYQENFRVNEATQIPNVAEDIFQLLPVPGMNVRDEQNSFNRDSKVLTVNTKTYTIDSGRNVTNLITKTQRIETRHPDESRHSGKSIRLALLISFALLPIWAIARMFWRRNL